MTMYGADVGQLRSLAQRMELAAQSLDSIAASLHSQVQGARWEGADGVRFSSDWSRRYRPDLRDVARRLDDAAKVIRRNAADQERASSSPGGSVRVRASRSWRNAVPARWVNHFGMSPRWGNWPGDWPLSDDRLVALVREVSQDALTIGGAADALYKWALDAKRLDLVGDWMKVGDGVGFLGTAVGAISGGYRLAEAWDNNDVDGWVRAGLDVSWSVASIIPVVGAGKASWDLGWFIGERIYDVGDVTGVNDAVQGSIIHQAIAKGHESELATRYDGIPGFGNFVRDSGSAFVEKLKFW